MALALHTLCGLSTAEVGRALLVPEQTMSKRLTRAKQKIARARIPYRVPDAAELPDRLHGVAATVYLLFTEGYGRADGATAADEALRLARLLHGLMPDEAAVLGLLALLLLQDSRRPARFTPAGDPVPLAEQDRTRWHRPSITEGVVLVGEGLRRTPDRPDPYVVQAAIAACHALAPTGADTDWAAVLSWYDVLLTVHDTPVVRLNRAVAVGECRGAEAALAELDALPGLGGYPLWHATRAEFLHAPRAGRRGADGVRRGARAPDARGTTRARGGPAGRAPRLSPRSCTPDLRCAHGRRCARAASSGVHRPPSVCTGAAAEHGPRVGERLSREWAHRRRT